MFIQLLYPELCGWKLISPPLNCPIDLSPSAPGFSVASCRSPVGTLPALLSHSEAFLCKPGSVRELTPTQWGISDSRCYGNQCTAPFPVLVTLCTIWKKSNSSSESPPQDQAPGAPRADPLIMPPWIPFPSFPVPLFPALHSPLGITSQSNDLHASLCFRLCFRGEPRWRQWLWNKFTIFETHILRYSEMKWHDPWVLL